MKVQRSKGNLCVCVCARFITLESLKGPFNVLLSMKSFHGAMKQNKKVSLLALNAYSSSSVELLNGNTKFCFKIAN